jgi:hypothetical protein
MYQSLAVLYNYTTSTPTSTPTHTGGAFIFFILISIAAGILGIVAFWKVFTKAGRPGWASIIPVYNAWVLFEISGKPGWWAFTVLLGVIPIVGFIPYIVLYILAMLELAKRFGKSTTFAVVGMIIFSLIGLLILGFGDAEYNTEGADYKPKTRPPVAPPSSNAPKVQ